MKHMDLSNRTDDDLLICLTYACSYTCDILTVQLACLLRISIILVIQMIT